jgi:hypothetical protein
MDAIAVGVVVGVIALALGCIVGVKIGADRANRARQEADFSLAEVVRIDRVGEVTDNHGVEYAKYLLSDGHGHEKAGYRRIIPTTYRYRCPDCGGAVVGVDAVRVKPGDSGEEPTAYRCEVCGRQEQSDFAVARVSREEGDLTLGSVI